MTLALYSHGDMENHQPGPGHPERSQRLGAVLDALAGLAKLVKSVLVPLATWQCGRLLALRLRAQLPTQSRPGFGAAQRERSTPLCKGDRSLTMACS